jgi:UPF0755 protein
MRNVRAFMLGITLIALVITCSGYLLLQEIQATVSESTRPVEVEIEQGDSTSQIATRLRAAGLIRQPMLFVTLVRMQGLEGKLQAGRYILRPSMTMSEILATLQHSRVDEVEFTIPEGLRLEEIAQRVGATGVVEEQEFLELARNGDEFRGDYFLLNSLPEGESLEGYLFPDTYRVPATSNPREIIVLMLDRFVEQYGKVETDVRVPDVNVHQVVTMASIVQREAAVLDEMPRIAAVFWNRLKPENMDETGGGKLQADPTVQYALGYSNYEQTWWRKELTFTDLKVDSPYNTREYAGLPPGPICSPGLDALKAAAQPDESANYLYFVASCDMDGTHNFATNFVDFQQFEAEFQACTGGEE